MITINSTSDSAFLSQLKVLLTSNISFERNIRNALKRLGEYKQADRVHIIDIRNDMISSISHEWNRAGVSPVAREVAGDFFLFEEELEGQLNRNDFIYIQHVEEVKDELLRHALEVSGVRQMLFLPLFMSHHSFSFLSLSKLKSDESWTREEIAFLMEVAMLLSGALEKEIMLARMIKQVYTMEYSSMDTCHKTVDIGMLPGNSRCASGKSHGYVGC